MQRPTSPSGRSRSPPAQPFTIRQLKPVVNGSHSGAASPPPQTGGGGYATGMTRRRIPLLKSAMDEEIPAGRSFAVRPEIVASKRTTSASSRHRSHSRGPSSPGSAIPDTASSNANYRASRPTRFVPMQPSDDTVIPTSKRSPRANAQPSPRSTPRSHRSGRDAGRDHTDHTGQARDPRKEPRPAVVGREGGRSLRNIESPQSSPRAMKQIPNLLLAHQLEPGRAVLARINSIRKKPSKFGDETLVDLVRELDATATDALKRGPVFQDGVNLAAIAESLRDELNANRPVKDLGKSLAGLEHAVAQCVKVESNLNSQNNVHAPLTPRSSPRKMSENLRKTSSLRTSAGHVPRTSMDRSEVHPDVVTPALVSLMNVRSTRGGAQGQTSAAELSVGAGLLSSTANKLPEYPEWSPQGYQLMSTALATPTTRMEALKLIDDNDLSPVLRRAAGHPSARPDPSGRGNWIPAGGIPEAQECLLHYEGTEGSPSKGGAPSDVPLEVLLKVATKRQRGRSYGGLDDAQPYSGLKDLVRQINTQNEGQVGPMFADLVGVMATRRVPKDIQDAQAHEKLLALLRANPTNIPIIISCLAAFSEMTDLDELAPFVAANVPAAVRANGVDKDYEAVVAYLELLEDLASQPDLLALLPSKKIIADLDHILKAGDSWLDESTKQQILDIKALISGSGDELTLREVYTILMSKHHNDESLNIMDSRVLKRLFRFIIKKVREYGIDREIEDGMFGFFGSEFMYGCLCLQVLALVEDNRPILKSRNVGDMLIESMRKQKDEQISQHAVLTSLELSAYPQLVDMFVDKKEKSDTIVDMLRRGREATQEELYKDVEDLVGPRVQLIERTAINRQIYSGLPRDVPISNAKEGEVSAAVTELLNVWDDHDFYFFGNIRVRNYQDLQLLFKEEKKMRKTENKKINNFMKRATAVFAKRTTAGASPAPAPAPGAPSPLERRKSIVGGAPALNERRGSMGGGNVEGGLARRASQFFTGGKAAQNDAKTIGLARRQSAISQPQKKGLFGGRRASGVVGELIDTAAPSPARASALQRRASMTPGANKSEIINIERKIGREDPRAFHDTKSSGENRSSQENLPKSSGENLSRFDEESFTPSIRSEVSNWDLWYDEESEGGHKVFIPKMLEYVFRALRKVVLPKDLHGLVDRNVPMRLVGVIADPETPPSCFPDALFLIGYLSPLENQRDLFGSYEAVENILRLIKRGYPQQGSYISEVVTNGCLALSTLCVLHLPNTRRFQKRQGTKIAVDILNVRGRYNDSNSINACSSLICNLCFKNEDMKKEFGDADACQALTNAMRNYKSLADADTKMPPSPAKHAPVASPVSTAAGTPDKQPLAPHQTPGVGLPLIASNYTGSKPSSQRSLASLFKAVGNLSLNKQNMDKFMQAEIEKAFSSFLGEADETLDDQTIESCLRTLSNLVIEKDIMQQFEVVVIPFLSLLRKEKNDSIEVHRWAFMTIANLCRWPENAKAFTLNQGIETILIILPFLKEKSLMLKSSIITVLGIQTTYPPNIETLIDSGTFKIISDTLTDFLDAIKADETATRRIYDQSASPDNNLTAEAQTRDILQFSQLPISALRCSHRLLKEPYAAYECVKTDTFFKAQLCLLQASSQPMLAYEALRVLMATMFLYKDDSFPKLENIPVLQDDEPTTKGRDKKNRKNTGQQFDRDVYFPDDGWGSNELEQLKSKTFITPPYVDPTELPKNESAEPQWTALEIPKQIVMPEPKPRIWQSLLMEKRMRQMVEEVRKILANEKAFKNVRLQRCGIGFLAWVATERICIPNLFRRLNVPIDPETGAPVEEPDTENNDVGPSRPQIQRRKSVWDAFKKKETSDQPKAPLPRFGRERKPDPTSCVDIITRTIENLWFDKNCLDEACILLNQLVFMAFGNPELSLLIADIALHSKLKDLLARLGTNVAPYWLMTLRNYQRFLQTEGKWYPDSLPEIVGGGGRSDSSGDEEEAKKVKKKTLSPDDLCLVRAMAIDEFPISLTQWDVDPFPDGVMSLPPETRALLRSGGRAELIDRDGSRKLILYKSSHDLVMFEWKVLPLDTKEAQLLLIDPTYPLALAVSRFSTIAHGLPQWAQKLPQQDKIPESKCAYLAGPATPSLPNGVNLLLKFKDTHSRDQFCLQISQWREACAFGFL